jgi:hypothetical protein
VKTASGVVVLVCLALAPVHASPQGSKGPKPSAVKSSQSKAPKAPKVTTVSQPSSKASKPAPAPKAAKAPKAPKSPAASPKADAKLAKVEAKTAKTSAKTEAKVAKADAKAGATAGTTATGDEGTTPTPTPGAVDFTSGRVGEKLTKNSNLRSKLESRLQAAGYTGSVYEAAYGFKNLGQFVAATNASQRTGIPFEQLRIQMTGYSVDATGTVLRANRGPDGTVTLVAPAEATNPAPTLSLGQSIKTLDPTVDATAEAQRATRQADAEIGATTVSN